MEYTDEIGANSNKLTIEIGEGRVLDEALLRRIKEIALSSVNYTAGEKEFFLSILNQPIIEKLEDWKLVKFVRIAEKSNVKIKLLGKPHLTVVSTKESQDKLITQLKACYLQDNRTKLRNILEEDGDEDEKCPVDISEAYVNLVTITKSATVNKSPNKEKKQKEQELHNEQDEKDEDGKLSLFQSERKISSFEQIYGKKEVYPLSQLMKSLKDREYNQDSKRILIEGWAGMGKTILCQYLTVMWAREVKEPVNRWWSEDIQLVLWVRLRNLAHYDSKNCTIGEVVRRECFGVEDSRDTNYPSAIQIEADIEALSNKVVFLLDGFDEVAEWYQEYQEGSHQTLTARSELLKDELLGGRHRHHVILMSRSGPVGRIERKFDRYLETSGFQDENIEGYIQKYFKTDPLQSEGLLSCMRQNANLWGVAHVPINLAMICMWWKENEKKGMKVKDVRIPPRMTMTALYSEAILLLLRRDWMKYPVNNKGVSQNFEHSNDEKLLMDARDINIEEFEEDLYQYPNTLKFLREVAWYAQTSSQYNLFTSGEKVVDILRKHYPELKRNSEYVRKLTDMKLLGLLESQQELTKIPVTKNQFYFSHLTFQEFFAAKYWVRKYCSNDKEEKKEAEQVFIQYKYHQQFEIVWWFVAGLLGKESKCLLENFFVLLNSKSCELVGVRHVTLLMRCLEESQDNQLINNLANKILSQIRLPGMMNVFFSNVLSLKYYDRIYKVLRLCPTLYKLDIFMDRILGPVKKAKEFIKLFESGSILFEASTLTESIGIINLSVESFILDIIDLELKNPDFFELGDERGLLKDNGLEWLNLNIVSENFIASILKMFYEYFKDARIKNNLNKCIYLVENINAIPFKRVYLYDENSYYLCVKYLLNNYSKDHIIRLLKAFKGGVLSDLLPEIIYQFSQIMLIGLEDSDTDNLLRCLDIVFDTAEFHTNIDIQKKCCEILKKLSYSPEEKIRKGALNCINNNLRLLIKETQRECYIILAEMLISIKEKNYEYEMMKVYVEYLCYRVIQNKDAQYEYRLKAIEIISSLPREFVSPEVVEICLATLKFWFNEDAPPYYNQWLLCGRRLSNATQFDEFQQIYMYKLINIIGSDHARQKDALEIVKNLPQPILNIKYIEEIISMLLVFLQHETSDDVRSEIINLLSCLLSDQISKNICQDCTEILVKIVEEKKENKLYFQCILIAIKGKLLLSNRQRTDYLIDYLKCVLSNNSFHENDNVLINLPYHLISNTDKKIFIPEFLNRYVNKRLTFYLPILKGLLKDNVDIKAVREIASHFVKLEKNPELRLGLLKLVHDSLLIEAIKRHRGDFQIPVYIMFSWYCVYYNRILILESDRENLRYQALNGEVILIRNKVLYLLISMVFESVRRKFNLHPSFENHRSKPYFMKKSKSTNDMLSCISRDTITFSRNSTEYDISFSVRLETRGIEIYISCAESKGNVMEVIDNIASFLRYKCANNNVEIERHEHYISLLAERDVIKWIQKNLINWIEKEFNQYFENYIHKTNLSPYCTIL